MSGPGCGYCGHPVAGALCAHCGAPAPAGATAVPPPPAVASVHRHGDDRDPGRGPDHRHGHADLTDPKTVTRAMVGAVRSRLVPEAESIVRKHHPAWQWRAALGILLAVLVVLAFLMFRSCSLPVPPGGFAGPGPMAGPARSLPGSLGSAACEPRDPATGVERCVVSASDPLLSGDITGGRELVLRVQVVSPGELTLIVRQWRSTGVGVVSDGPVFASISAASAVLYADTDSGLRIDTGSFSNKAAAQTFLTRSGLLGSR